MRRGDPRLDGAHLLGDVEVAAGEGRDHLVGLALHPLPQRVGAVELVGRVAVEVVDRLGDAGTGHDPVGGGTHLGRDPRELLLPPGVRLLEVHRGAQEAPGGEGVAVAADGIRLGRPGEEVGAEGLPSRR